MPLLFLRHGLELLSEPMGLSNGRASLNSRRNSKANLFVLGLMLDSMLPHRFSQSSIVRFHRQRGLSHRSDRHSQCRSHHPSGTTKTSPSRVMAATTQANCPTGPDCHSLHGLLVSAVGQRLDCVVHVSTVCSTDPSELLLLSPVHGPVALTFRVAIAFT